MRRWPWVVATLGSAAIGIAIGVAWWLGGSGQAGAWATILALLVVGLALFGWAQAAAQARPTSTPDQVDAAARMLVGEVLGQWREEAGRRGLTDPAPLAVRWRAVPPPLGDQRRPAGEISGRSDQVADLADRFLGLTQRRLVVIGPPGAGKTSLAVLLTLELCRRYEEAGGPVPVLLSPGSWNPAGERLHTWIERQLNALYPALRAAEYGPTAARSLLAAGHLLPVLDGLDELPDASKGEALQRIDEMLREGGPLVVTCRTQDFEIALRDADVLTGAAVIGAEPVRLEDAEEFLLGGVEPGSPAVPSWLALLAAARSSRQGPVAAALSNPLLVWLMRVVYADVGRSPEELAELPNVPAIEGRLLDALVPTVFDSGRQDRWEAPAAQRWLVFLAGHLDRLGTRDLGWWRLREDAPLVVRLVLFGLLVGLLEEVMVQIPGFGTSAGTLVVALMLAAVFGFLGAFQDPDQRRNRRTLHPLLVWLSSGLAGPGGWAFARTIATWAAATLGVTLAAWLWSNTVPFLGGAAVGALAGLLAPQRPGRATLTLRGRRQAVLQALGALLASLPVIVVVLAPFSRLQSNSVQGMLLALLSTLTLVVLPTTFVIAVTRVIQTPASTDPAMSPRATLQNDRALTLFTGPALALVIGPAVGALLGVTEGLLLHPGAVRGVGPGTLAGDLGTGLILGLAGGLAALVFGLGRPWLSFLIAHGWLALGGRLPWRLMSFLDDAHRLGLLRQVGPFYEFRHAGLQDRLARTAVPAVRPPPHP